MSPAERTTPSASATPVYGTPAEVRERELAALLGSTEPLVVESHFGGWDTPWRALSELGWREIAREFGERVNRAVVETGANRELAVRYGLEVIPAVLVFAGGDVVARFTGSVRAEDVAAAVRETLARARELDVARSELELEPHAERAARSVAWRRAGDDALARAG